MDIPGFIDVQVNGFLGIDFSSESSNEADCIKACQALLERGTVGFLPTVITSSEDIYEKNLPIIAKVMAMPEFKNKLLGIHIEGPFISPEPGAVGAHNPKWVQEPNIDLFKKILDWSNGTVKMLTIAAEQPNADKLAKFATEQGVVVSLGHQLATEDDLKRLSDAGAKCLTHLSNGMPNMIHRHKNTIWAGLANDDLIALLITDGHHVPASLIKVALRAKGLDKVIVTSDAAPLAGFPPGKYHVLGNDAVIEENGLLHNPVKGCMVGSSATMIQCMNYLAKLDYLTLDEMLKVGFYNPLELLNIDPQLIQSDTTIRYDESSKTFSVVTD